MRDNAAAGNPPWFDAATRDHVRRALGALLLAAAATTAQAAPPPPPEAALDRIEAAGLAARIRFLSDDQLEGRGTGTRGYDVAATYVATQLEALGLEPAGEGQSWFQDVPLVRTYVEPGATIAVLDRKGRRQVIGEQALVFPGPLATGLDVDAEVVFVGYGIEAPTLGRDDYKGLDVKGRVVAVLGNAPQTFPGDERAHHGSPTVKEAVAARHGAAGIVHLLPLDTAAPMWRMLTRVQKGVLRWIPRETPDAKPIFLPFAVAFTGQGSAQLLEGSGRTLAELQKSGKPGLRLPIRLQVQGKVQREATLTRNVAGVLRGHGPLAAETVVFTAHLDHLGVSAGEGDQVHNGAADNASGVAALIETAEAFRAAPVAPRRSVLFVAVAAEESGLLGSSYFAAYPTVPAASIVADVNLDMLPLQAALQPLREVIAFGAEHSSLKAVVARAAEAEGLSVIPDPIPDQRVFVRSDQYSFVKEGVPAVMLFAGGGKDPAVPWLPVFMKWMGTVYHGPEDELGNETDVSGAVRLSRVSFRIGWEVAHDTERPRWNKGDFFGETFGRKR